MGDVAHLQVGRIAHDLDRRECEVVGLAGFGDAGIAVAQHVEPVGAAGQAEGQRDRFGMGVAATRRQQAVVEDVLEQHVIVVEQDVVQREADLVEPVRGHRVADAVVAHGPGQRDLLAGFAGGRGDEVLHHQVGGLVRHRHDVRRSLVVVFAVRTGVVDKSLEDLLHDVGLDNQLVAARNAKGQREGRRDVVKAGDEITGIVVIDDIQCTGVPCIPQQDVAVIQHAVGGQVDAV